MGISIGITHDRHGQLCFEIEVLLCLLHGTNLCGQRAPRFPGTIVA
jgi:hypothetical protein